MEHVQCPDNEPETLAKSHLSIFENLEFLFIKKFSSKKKGKPRKTEGTVRSSQKIARYENIETQVFLFKKVLDVPFFF